MIIHPENGRMPQVSYKPFEDAKIGTIKKTVNFVVGKDSDGEPKYLLEKGVQEVVGYYGDDDDLIITAKNPEVYGFKHVQDRNNGTQMVSYCPFAVVKTDKKSEPVYLSMFGEMKEKPTKEGMLFFLYKNKQITLDDIPFHLLRQNPAFREAVMQEEIDRRIVTMLDQSYESGKEVDFETLFEGMDNIKSAFDAKTPEEFFRGRCYGFKVPTEEYEQWEAEYLQKQKELAAQTTETEMA